MHADEKATGVDSTGPDVDYAQPQVIPPSARAWLGTAVANAFMLFISVPLSGPDVCISICMGQLIVLCFWMMFGTEDLRNRLQLGPLLAASTLFICANRTGFGLDNLISQTFGLGTIVVFLFAVPFWYLKSRGWEFTHPHDVLTENHQFSIRWILAATLVFAVIAAVHGAFADKIDVASTSVVPSLVRALAVPIAWTFFAGGTIAIIWAVLSPLNLPSRLLKALLYFAPATLPLTVELGSKPHQQWLILIVPAVVCVTVSLLCVRQSGLRLVNRNEWLRKQEASRSDESLQLD